MIVSGKMQKVKEKDLIVNPYLYLKTFEDEERFILFAPKPKFGLQELEIYKSKEPRLFEIFSDLSKTKFEFLNIEKDLTESEAEFLLKNAVLVRSGEEPEKPLFSCKLETIEPFEGTINFSDLIVNPTFRFEPFNMANFVSWVHEKNMSPYQPTVWIKTPVVDIETGFWVENELAQLFSKFKPGNKIPEKVSEELILKLFTAKILTTKNELQMDRGIWKSKIQRAQSIFEKEKYVKVEELLTQHQIEAMRRYYRKYVAQGFMPYGDNQVKNRFYQHNEPLARFFHTNFTKLISSVVGKDLIPSYVYAASYLNNATLEPHRDRIQCEYSISFQIDYQPEPEESVSPWAIHLSEPENKNETQHRYDWNEFPETLENGKKRKGVHLANGDGLFYMGCDLIHYRYELPTGHTSTSLFFHYVPEGFEHNLT